MQQVTRDIKTRPELQITKGLVHVLGYSNIRATSILFLFAFKMLPRALKFSCGGLPESTDDHTLTFVIVWAQPLFRTNSMPELTRKVWFPPALDSGQNC